MDIISNLLCSMIPASSDNPDFFAKFTTKDYPAHKKSVYSIGWNCTGSNLASASEDYTIKVWNLTSSGIERAHDLKDHTNVVEQLAWHPENPDLLASVSADKTLKLWDMRASKKNIKTVSSKDSNLNLAWAPDGKTIAVGTNEDCVAFYEAGSLTSIKQMKFDREVNAISWNVSGQIFLIATSSENGLTGPITVIDGKQLTDIEGMDTLDFHRGRCYCVAMDPKGKYFATGAADALIALWDVEELVSIKAFSKRDCPIRQLSFSHDGMLIASAAEDTTLEIFHVDKPESVKKIECNSIQQSVAWHPSRFMLAYTLEDKDKGGEGCPIHLFGVF